MNELTKPINHEILLDEGYAKIAQYLESMGLPSKDVIAPIQERKTIADLIPGYINKLPIELKRDGRYLSKFVVGAGFGLFDYALNAVWNEVVLALRDKAITYGIDIFYDAAIGGNLRAQYKDEKDLPAVKDITMLDTCKKIELISDVIYLKLKHILEMRNEVGISHPTEYSVKAFELMGWLQTCVEEVIADRPSASAIQVKTFIDNLRQCTNVLSATEVKTMEPHIHSLSTVHCANITRTIFGIFVDPSTNATTRKNISLLAPTIWKACPENAKYKFGIMLEGYNNNMHQQRYILGGQFFDLCDANRYRTHNERIIKIAELCDQLDSTHDAMDNFYHEVPIAERLSTYFKTELDIPDQALSPLCSVLLKCRIGRGVSYCQGLSQGAKPCYDYILGLIGDRTAPYIIVAITNPDIQYQLTKEICMGHLVDVLNGIRSRLVNQRIVEGIDYILANCSKGPKIVFDSKFKEISHTYITW